MEAVDEDNVHLTRRANKFVAEILINRLEELRKVDKRTHKVEKKCHKWVRRCQLQRK